jgi:predicted dehydrogenase
MFEATRHTGGTRSGAAPLRAGLIGLGQMGRHHARVLRTLEGVELVGVADPAAGVLELTGLGLDPGTSLVSSVDELLRQRLDMAVVAAPTSTHEQIAVQLASHGVHALIEKPVADDVASADRMADAFETAALVGCVGHIERYNPALQEMRRRLARGELGEIYQVTTRRTGPFPARIADVGVILDLATHDIDSTAWVTGRSYQTVSARTAHRSGRAHEDLVAVVATLEDGIVASHLVNWLSPLKERVSVVTGERGSLVADTLAADLTFFANGVAPVDWESLQSFRGVVQGDVIRYAIAKPEPLRVELEAFRDAVLGVRDDVVSLREGAEVVRVAEAMLASSTSGGTERVASPVRAGRPS